MGARFAFDEVVYLRDAGVEVTTIIPASMPGMMADLYTKEGLPIVDQDPNFYPPRPGRSIANARALRKILRSLSPDIVHVHHVASCLFLRLATGRRPAFKRIFEVHGPLHLESPHTRLVDLRTRGPQDFYIATSESVRKRYLGLGIPENDMTLVYSGSHTSEYMRPRRGLLRAELGIDEATPLVGLVAWMYPPKAILGQRTGLKGHDLFIQAIPRVLERIPDARFIFVGGVLAGAARYVDHLNELAGRLGVTHVLTFLGGRDDVRDIQPDLDVAAHPSRSENPGGSVYTLLAGVPTTGSSVGGIPEIVRHRETGLIFPPDDAPALASAIIELLEDRTNALEMAARGQALAQEMFDISKTAPKVLDFYEHVLG